MSASVLSRIDNQMEGLEPGSTRYLALSALRVFRSTWVELGKLLTDVAYGGDYKEWGYEDFEVYCARELGLKKPTVKKLMVSYNYMKSYAPERLETVEGEDGYDVPDYQTVELLKKAREREDIAESEKEELHRMAFDGTGDEGVLRKEIRQRMKPVEQVAPDSDEKEFQRILLSSRKVRQKVAACRKIPESVRDAIDQALLQLEALD